MRIDNENKEVIVGGKYVVEEKIGKGAFGQVYKGHIKDTEKTVAIKFVLQIIMFRNQLHKNHNNYYARRQSTNGFKVEVLATSKF